MSFSADYEGEFKEVNHSMVDICAIKRGRPKLNRRSIGHKTCSYGLCKSSGKKITEVIQQQMQHMFFCEIVNMFCHV